MDHHQTEDDDKLPHLLDLFEHFDLADGEEKDQFEGRGVPSLSPSQTEVSSEGCDGCFAQHKQYTPPSTPPPPPPPQLTTLPTELLLQIISFLEEPPLTFIHLLSLKLSGNHRLSLCVSPTPQISLHYRWEYILYLTTTSSSPAHKVDAPVLVFEHLRKYTFAALLPSLHDIPEPYASFPECAESKRLYHELARKSEYESKTKRYILCAGPGMKHSKKRISDPPSTPTYLPRDEFFKSMLRKPTWRRLCRSCCYSTGLSKMLDERDNDADKQYHRLRHQENQNNEHNPEWGTTTTSSFSFLFLHSIPNSHSNDQSPIPNATNPHTNSSNHHHHHHYHHHHQNPHRIKHPYRACIHCLKIKPRHHFGALMLSKSAKRRVCKTCCGSNPKWTRWYDFFF